MPRPIPLKDVLTALKKEGFCFVSQKGSHAKYRKSGSNIRTVIVPMHGKEIPHGTFRSILRQAGISEADFFSDRN